MNTQYLFQTEALSVRRYSSEAWRRTAMNAIADPFFAEAVFDCVPDVVFSVKDREGRYICISQACVERCGLSDRSEAIGRTAHELFPKHMADRYVEQDARLFRTGKPIIDNLDLTLYPDRNPGWCITNKFPQYNAKGELIALACVSKDLVDPGRNSLVDEDFARTIDYIQENIDQQLRIPALARMAGLSSGQFERRMKCIFHISAVHFLIKTRIHLASLALAREDRSIAEIALSCGFCDQSALSRQFKQLTGLTPREYRVMTRGQTEAECA
jgi:AraC-like DNA-binding protein